MPAGGADDEEAGGMSDQPATPLRSLLFVPGDSERKQAKALGSGADALILDLEDSVQEAQLPAARVPGQRIPDGPSHDAAAGRSSGCG